MNQVSQDSEDNARISSPINNNNNNNDYQSNASNGNNSNNSSSSGHIAPVAMPSSHLNQQHPNHQLHDASLLINDHGNNQSHKTGKEPVNGHYDPSKRRLYISILIFSILNALIGLILILVWMLYYRPVTGFGLSSSGQMANLHPLLMYTFMVSMNMYTVLIYRTHYCKPKSQLKWAHAILSGVNIVMSLLGVALMFKAHLMANQANFYSLHSWIGAMTNAFYLIQFVSGCLAFLKPNSWVTQNQRAKLMPWHRLAGTAILVLASLAAITGIAELVIFQDSKTAVYAKFAPITFIANLAGICTILMTASSVYLLTERIWLRPVLPEEAPLKR